MKLRYKFVVRDVDGRPIAVAVGTDNEQFNGMIKLNPSGAWLFKILNEENAPQEQIVQRFSAEFGVAEEDAKPVVLEFLDYLRQNEMLQE